MSNEIQLWTGPREVTMPSNIKKPEDIVSYANAVNLTVKQQQQIISAFQVEAYDMAAEYTWKKGMMKLKETLSTLGMKFIGEMLRREDIDEFDSIDTVLTDYATIQLAEQLGVINTTAALKLRQSQELITHFFSNKANEELDFSDALSIVKNSIRYILGEQDISIAIEFSNLRNRLLNESLKRTDLQVDQLINSPLFYLRTVLTILLSSIKKDKGAALEHVLANINLLLPEMWSNLSDNDKWDIGTAYRDVVADGNNTAAKGLKKSLLKVEGFDYVPESLRSNTFKNAARMVIETHFSFNNFYNEPAVVKALASLGSTIPAPALLDCITAYLVVYIGNSYGVSTNAAQIAYEQLSKITIDRWKYYFEKGIIKDEIILQSLNTTEQINRFYQFLKKNDFCSFEDLPKDSQILYNNIIEKKYINVNNNCKKLLKNIKP